MHVSYFNCCGRGTVRKEAKMMDKHAHIPYTCSGKFLRVLIFAFFVGQSKTAKIATAKIIYLKGVTLFQGQSSKF